MKRVPMRSKDLQELLKSYSFEVEKKDLVEMADDKIVLINKKPCFFYYEKKLVPTLHVLQTHTLLKKIVVDMGAVKFLIGGADVMRPGVKEIDPSIQKEEFVVVVDMNNKKPLCVGVALFSAEDMEKQSTGKVIKNIHYVGDSIWKFI
ncbi:DUF1947 domain-containing protein [Candidatus Woesearchaeota archaeon]|nr:DUF1947 domain-containing protein [Candidatus Woesearchaeota archaeon]